MLNFKEGSLTWESKTGKRKNTKGRSWEIQSMRDWTDCNISSSKLQQAAIQKGGKKKTEPCRFVSEGEKPVVRSNRPLIFLSCIKRSSLLGGYASEQALLIFTVYLVLFANIYIHLSKIHPTMHDTEKPLSFNIIVFLCLSEELQHPISLTRLPQLL